MPWPVSARKRWMRGATSSITNRSNSSAWSQRSTASSPAASSALTATGLLLCGRANCATRASCGRSDPPKRLQLTSRPFVREFVSAERELRLTSPRSETPHGKARGGMLYPNGYLLLPDIYRAVFERIGARTIRATKIFPGDFHGSDSLKHDPEKCAAVFGKDHAQTRS